MPHQCNTDADCPRTDAPCSMCADGTLACPASACLKGECTFSLPTCSEPNVCGGSSGKGCDPGFQCAEKCDPAVGCSGVCIPAPPKPMSCGGFTGQLCPAGFDCVDDPSDECDPPNGGADCSGICQPAMPPQCSTDADCPNIGAPCRLCADGTYAC